VQAALLKIPLKSLCQPLQLSGWVLYLQAKFAGKSEIKNGIEPGHELDIQSE